MITRRVETTLNYVVLLFFSAIALFPIVGVLLLSVGPPDNPSPGFAIPDSVGLTSFTEAWEVAGFGTSLRSSVIVTTAVVAVTCVFSILAGYALGMMRFRGAQLLFFGILLGLMIPTEATIVPLYYDLREFDLTNTYAALILPQVGSLVAFGTFWMRAFFRAAPPTLVEAARLEGASTWTILWRILVPIGRPAILTMAALLFLWSWNEFMLALVMISDEELRTAPLGLNFFQGRRSANYALLGAGSVIVALPVIVAYVFLQRHFIRGMLGGALKS